MKNPESSEFIVSPQRVRIEQTLLLACGYALKNYQLAYETYGKLNSSKSNAILICHALSSDHHAAGKYSAEDKKPGWWDHYIGPGKPIDSNKFFIVCANNIGGCNGSEGPNTINIDTKALWEASFPKVRVRDWVHSQKQLMDYLGIPYWAAVIGSSLGGMQAQRWSLEYPDLVKYCCVIASSMKLSAQNIAFNNIARQAILSDPDFLDGYYLSAHKNPDQGLSIARMVGHITYISDDTMSDKFGRNLRQGSFQQGQNSNIEFQVESYLRYQGSNFSKQFDANTYLLMTRALEYFDLAREYDHDPVQAFSHARCNYFVTSFSSDWRFSPERSREMVFSMITAGKNVSYLEIESKYGHDAFLLPNSRFENALSTYLDTVYQEVSHAL